MTNGSLVKVDSIAEFCNTFDQHYAIIGLENQLLVFFLSGGLRQVLLYSTALDIRLSSFGCPNFLTMEFYEGIIGKEPCFPITPL